MGLPEGFWGLVDQHVEVGLVNNQTALMRDGKPLVEQPGVDFADLVEAEEAVALLAAPVGNRAVGGLESSRSVRRRSALYQ